MADMEAENDDNSLADACHELLMRLKCTVERLLAVQTSNVWSTYGGFKRICSHVEAILSHRIRVTQVVSQSEGVFWPFVRGLKWLRPGVTSTMEQVSRSSCSTGQGGKGQMWLRESLQDHSLSSQLEILVSDSEHLHYHYQEGAFLRNEEYVKAMLICLHAVESNKVAGLAEINPKLLQPNKPLKEGIAAKRSSFSLAQCESAHLSQSAPNLASSSTFRELEQVEAGVNSYGRRAEGGSTAALSDSLSTSLYTSLLTSPSLSPADEVSSQPPDVLGCYHSDATSPMEIQYGSSPPYKPETTSVLCSSASDGVFPRDCDDQSYMDKNQLDKCVSDLSEQSEAEMHPAKKSVTRDIQKKIHIPVTENGKITSKPRHSLQDQRQPNFETKSSISTASKGHKRSQSDFGVGSKKNRVQSVIQDNGFQSDWARASSDRSAFETGGKSNERDEKVGLHRGDSLFHRPAKGQSLMSYLSEQDFNCCALLERENAHFGISDVMISVFEQMKWETSLRKNSLVDNVTEDEESDEEINELKQRIRIRRRERLVEKAKTFPANSDGMNDTNTTSSALTASSPLSSNGFSSLSDSSEHSDDAEEQIELTFTGTETSNLAKLKSSSLSLSMASLYSDAELKKSNQTVDPHGVSRQSSEKSNFSAEAIAMSLLSQFSEKRLPKASELDWLVSEKDAPQALLPLPNSYPVSPDDGENADLMKSASKTKLRGNLEWAPPRAQIIFTIHPQEKRSVVLSRQNMRCAGCGTKIEPGFVKRLRYCEYMGKYFCQCCHSNDIEVIPGRVIMRWDFTRYYVSNFARDLLLKMFKHPLFHVDAINPALYKRVRVLESVKDFRRQLGHLKTLLNICKRNIKWLEDMEKLPRHLAEDDNLYSMEDFMAVRAGSMLVTLRSIVTEAMSHVESCPLCQGLGFICEICQGTDVIFPFQLNCVTLCPVCQACYHKSCYVPGKCPKCSRFELRRKRQSQLSPTETVKGSAWKVADTRDNSEVSSVTA